MEASLHLRSFRSSDGADYRGSSPVVVLVVEGRVRENYTSRGSSGIADRYF